MSNFSATDMATAAADGFRDGLAASCQRCKQPRAEAMSDLPKRLRIKASMIALGERIAWGSDTALMEEAADVIEALSASVENHQLHMLGMARDRDQLRAELSALKAQQEPVAWRVTGAGGLTVTPEYPKWAEDDSRLLIESLYTAPQQAPAQDVAERWTVACGDWRETLLAIHGERTGHIASGVPENAAHAIVKAHNAGLPELPAAHDKQSGVGRE